MSIKRHPRVRFAARLCACLWGAMIVGWGTNASAQADHRAATPAETDRAAPVVLPRLTVTSERLDPRWLIPKKDLKSPDFRGVRPEVFFPYQAKFKGIHDGRAVIGVMLDADGKPTDFIAVRYTQPYFAEELLTAIRNETFTPRRVKGVAVPGTFYVGQRFYPFRLALTPMEAWSERFDRIANSLRGGPPFIYEPQLEHLLDGHALQFTAAEPPMVAVAGEAAAGGPIKVVVCFYVDEKGDVRLPNVESATAPELTPPVLRAVARWKFLPPTIKGKPALVFAIRSVVLDPPASSAPPASAIRNPRDPKLSPRVFR